MPNIKSAKKRMRQSEERRVQNRAKKSELRTQVRKIRDALKAGDVTAAQKEMPALAKKFDQAAAKGVIHDNHAARIKSRVSAAVKAAKGKVPAKA